MHHEDSSFLSSVVEQLQLVYSLPRGSAISTEKTKGVCAKTLLLLFHSKFITGKSAVLKKGSDEFLVIKGVRLTSKGFKLFKEQLVPLESTI